MPKGSYNQHSLIKENYDKHSRYTANNLSELMDKIARNSIGLDSYIDQVWGTTAQTYPPYNIVQHSNHESSLEIALAGFKKKEVKVYTEHGKLHVEGKKEEKKESEYVHRGMAQRSFERSCNWSVKM